MTDTAQEATQYAVKLQNGWAEHLSDYHLSNLIDALVDEESRRKAVSENQLPLWAQE